MKPVERRIKRAELLLRGISSPEGKLDPWWQSIIEIGEYIETEPQEVWNFIRKWGTHRNKDIRTAIAVCLLEHLIEYHFDEYFPLVRETCQKSKRFTATFKMCSQFGQAELPENSKAFDRLKNELA